MFHSIKSSALALALMLGLILAVAPVSAQDEGSSDEMTEDGDSLDTTGQDAPVPTEVKPVKKSSSKRVIKEKTIVKEKTAKPKKADKPMDESPEDSN